MMHVMCLFVVLVLLGLSIMLKEKQQQLWVGEQLIHPYIRCIFMSLCKEKSYCAK